MRCEWEIEHGYAFDAKSAQINRCVATGGHIRMTHTELPLWTRQLAVGYGAVVYDVMIRTSFHDNLAGKLEWDWGCQKIRPRSLARSNPTGHIVKSPDFSANVVLSVTRLNVFIVGTTVKYDVAVQRDVAGIGVVGSFIRPQCGDAVLNSSADMQFEDGAVLLLSNCTNSRLVF
jgi:hypothetical protein